MDAHRTGASHPPLMASRRSVGVLNRRTVLIPENSWIEHRGSELIHCDVYPRQQAWVSARCFAKVLPQISHSRRSEAGDSL